MICISRVLAAGGREVRQLVAEELGYLHVDEEIVQQAAASEGVSADELADVERRTTFMNRLLQSLAVAGGAEGHMVGVAALALPATSDRKSLRALIRESIEETAERGEVVIVSHTASHALAGRGDVCGCL